MILRFMSKLFWDGLGRFGLYSTVRWSCIGRVFLGKQIVENKAEFRNAINNVVYVIEGCRN